MLYYLFCQSSAAQKLFDLSNLAGISLLLAKFVWFSGKMAPKSQSSEKDLLPVTRRLRHQMACDINIQQLLIT